LELSAMTPRLLGKQLRERQRLLEIVPDEVLDALSDEDVIRSYCVTAAKDDNSLQEIVAKSETVHDFLDKLISDREAAKRMWPQYTVNMSEIDSNEEANESKADLLRYLPFSHMRDFGSPILFAFTEETVQEFATENCGGPLSEEELCELYFAFCESFDCPFLEEAISKVRPPLRAR
jgi:hypothetical protein